ncbi:Ig-like domain-containing protein, partial [Cellulomonas denverensis]
MTFVVGGGVQPATAATADDTAKVEIRGTDFNVRLASGFNGEVRSIIAAHDGGVIVGGNFTSFAGNSSIPNRLVKINADGTLNHEFNANLGTGFGGVVYDVIALSDGGYLVAGNFTSLAGNSGIPNRLVRLNADGTVDARFNAQLGTGFNGVVWTLAEDSAGNLLVGGAFTSLSGNSSIPNYLVRLKANGSLDADFNARLGTGFNSAVYSVAIAPEDKVVVGGAFNRLNNDATVPNALLRLNADGSLDWEHNAELGTGFNGNVRSVSITSVGGTLVGGTFTSANANSAVPSRLVKLKPNGAMDAEFNVGLGSGFNGTVQVAVETADQGVMVGGSFTSLSGSAQPRRLMKLDANGMYDAAFNDNLVQGFDSTVYDVLINGGDAGGYLIAGAFRSLAGSRFIPARMVYLQDDGTPGPDFNSQLSGGFNGDVRVSLETSDGKILVGGNFTSFRGDATAPDRLLRLNSDGSLDEAFAERVGTGLNSVVYDVAEQADGKILVAGNFTSLNGDATASDRLIRLNQDGTLDREFNTYVGTGFNSAAWTVEVTAEGKILVGGAFTSLSGNSSIPNRMVQLNEDGTLNTEFTGQLGTGFNSYVYDIHVQEDGKVVVGGNFTSLAGNSGIPNRLVRLNADGKLDTEFTGKLGTGFNSVVMTVFVSDKGQVLVGGNFTSLNGSTGIPRRLVRLVEDGSLDYDFNSRMGRGFNYQVESVLQSADGGVLVGGRHTALNNNSASPDRLVLLNASGSINTDFSGQLGRGFNGRVYSVTETSISGNGYLAGGTFTTLDRSSNIPARLIKLHTAASQEGGEEVVAEPQITAPLNDEVFDATGLVRGTGQPGRTITVTAGGQLLGTTVVNERGDWMIRVSTPLTQGTHAIEAEQEETENTAMVTVDVLGHAVEAWGTVDGYGYDSQDSADRVIQISSSDGSDPMTVAVTEDGRALVWGVNAESPVRGIASQQGLVQVSVGDGFVLGLTRDGRVVGAGSNAAGQLDLPAALDGATVVAVEAGQDMSYALLADGTVVAWGANDSGQTTLPEALDSATAVQLSAGDDHVLALTASGEVIAWGSDAEGQSTVPLQPEEETVPDEDEESDPDGPSAVDGFVRVVAGAATSMAVDADGTVTGWGRNAEQQLDLPAGVQGAVQRLALGHGSATALLTDGTIAVWGADAAAWQQVSDELDRMVAVDVAAGRDHGVALVDRVDITSPTAETEPGSISELAGTAAPNTTLSVTVGNESGSRALSAEVGADGRWSVPLTSGIDPGIYTATAVSAAGAYDSVTVDVSWQSALAASGGAVAADGVATHWVEVTAADATGNPVQGAQVVLTLPEQLILAGGAAAGTTGADGTYRVLVASKVAGEYEVTATVNGQPVTVGSPAVVRFESGPLSVEHSS